MQQIYTNWICSFERRAVRRSEDSNPEPFSWGWECLPAWTGFTGIPAVEQACALGKRIVEESGAFFSYQRPSDFQLDGRGLRFQSPVESAWPENDRVSAHWYPSGRAKGRAVLLLPHWNAALGIYAGISRLLNLYGISALVLALPCHDRRKPAAARAAEYLVSANLGRTLAFARQAVIDARCCVDWLEQQGYTRLGMAGTSLGSGYGFLTSAHEPRLTVNVFNHCSSSISDVAWLGIPRIRQQLQRHVSQDQLREIWSPINPISYFDRFAKSPKKSLLLTGRYDEVFPRSSTQEVIRQFQIRSLAHRVLEFPCGHYTMGWPPYCLVNALAMCNFLSEEL